MPKAPPDSAPNVLLGKPGLPYSKQHKCLVGKHKDIVKECAARKPPSQAHHIIPDRVYRANVGKQKNLVQYRVKGAPRYSDGMAVCIPSSSHVPKGGVHHHLDDALQRVGRTKTPPNIAPIGEIRVHALVALQKLVPKDLSLDCFQQAVLKVYAQTDPIAGKIGRTSQG
jgi:hypothetical protein